jgi:hypothetical protein
MYVRTDSKAETILEYPYSVEKLRRDNPQISFPITPTARLLAEYNVFAVCATTPGFDPILEVAEQAGCCFNEATGQWESAWVVRPKTLEEIEAEATEQAESVRAERNAYLAASDWTQLADAPVDSAAWVNYRQALRDVTAQVGFPWSVDWPTPPG